MQQEPQVAVLQTTGRLWANLVIGKWLTGLIREVHIASRGTYGYRRVHAELTMAMDVTVSSRLVFTSPNDFEDLHGAAPAAT